MDSSKTPAAGRVECDPVADGTATPDTPERGMKDFIKDLLSTPGGVKLASLIVLAIAVVILAALYFGSKHMEKKAQPEKSSHVEGSRGKDGDEGPVIIDELPTKLPDFIKVDEPKPKDEPKVEGKIETNPFANAIPLPPPIPPMPPEWIDNPNVKPEFSLNSPHAVSGNAEVLSKGYRQLPSKSQDWCSGRARNEVTVYRDAVVASQVALYAAGGARSPAAAQAKRIIPDLDKAKQVLAGYPTNEEFAQVIQCLITADDYLRALSRDIRITIPDLTEKPNPAYAEWVRKYGK
jgi:hypothetical protein